MSIAALPPQAVHAIGSAQVLTDSASLVKELVDNALDAQATSITVELSTNALDVIQVKDNGHGIAPADRALVCRRNCTSKIKDLDDLANIGGASLGFRGEALASTVEMSGSVVIRTRIIGEATAVSLKVSCNGEVENEDRVSQAVGTAIRVTDFLRTFPVRRQTALKDPTKQLAKVKRMLQAYALARPAVRLGMKVLKAKNDKGNWTYAPKSDANVGDAATKIFGRKVSDQCQWVVWNTDQRSLDIARDVSAATDHSTNPGAAYRVEALIPKPDSDLSAICSVGHFISVDSRPVSCTRGTLKQVVQLSKSYLRSSSSTPIDQKTVDPFLCMNIVCPPGSYDANVEPAKDDVLFADSSRVLKLVEVFLRSHYGDLKLTVKQTANSRHGIPKPRAFDLLLARKPPPKIMESAIPEATNSDPSASAPVHSIENGASSFKSARKLPSSAEERMEAQQAEGVGSSGHLDEEEVFLEAQSSPRGAQHGTKQMWHHGMDVDTDKEGLAESELAAQSQESEDADDLRDVTVMNPWTLAKVNAPIGHQKSADGPSNDLSRNYQLLTPAKGHGDLSQGLSSPLARSVPNIPTPAKSQDVPLNAIPSPDIFPYPKRAWGKAHREVDTSPYRSPSSEEPEPSSRPLNDWVQRTPAQPRAADQALVFTEQGSTPNRPRSDFVSATTLPQGTPLSAIPDISQKPRRKPQRPSNNVNKPFTAPVRDLTRVWFDQHEPSSSSARSQQPKKPRRGQDVLAAIAVPSDPIVPPSPSIPPVSIHPGLALTMDYEKRKADAITARRAFLRQKQPSQPLLPPSLSRNSSPINPSQTVATTLSQNSSPHENRYRSARGALQPPHLSTGEDIQGKGASAIDPKDPRAYLMRVGKERTKRIKTSLLPLEALSAEEEGGVRDLVQVIRTEGLVGRIEEGVRRVRMGLGDALGRTGFEDVGEGEARVWEEQVKRMIERVYAGMGEVVGQGEEEVEIYVKTAVMGRERERERGV
ncbi:MAG: hypothetical protein LQ343_006395 [Gyalolechia ehrenbergii]|nr:MAG: hypothetical protein LQ343_006395 [Gyalolechia ehrenbergii]